MFNLTQIPLFPALAAAAAPVAILTATGFMSPVAVATSVFALSFFSGLAAVVGANRRVYELEEQPGHPDLEAIKSQMKFAVNAFEVAGVSLACMYGLWKFAETQEPKPSFTLSIHN
jgi:hypothetical protein